MVRGAQPRRVAPAPSRGRWEVRRPGSVCRPLGAKFGGETKIWRGFSAVFGLQLGAGRVKAGPAAVLPRLVRVAW